MVRPRQEWQIEKLCSVYWNGLQNVFEADWIPKI